MTHQSISPIGRKVSTQLAALRAGIRAALRAFSQNTKRNSR